MTNELAVALSVDALGSHLTGIGRYCLELADRLPAELGEDNLTYFRGNHWLDNPRDLLRDDWRPVRAPIWKRPVQAWKQWRRQANAIVHAPNYFLPVWAERGVATIHDLSVFLYPETHPTERVKIFEQQFARTLEQALMIITDTQTVRHELISTFAINPDKIQAVPLGISQTLSDPDLSPLSGLRLRPKKYLLCVSTFEPRKRIAELVMAYRMLPLALRREFPLVLAGATGWHNETLDELLRQSCGDGTVMKLGYVPEASLAALYAGARIFVYPSRYEGFGLPVLEAMSHGVPCLISNTPCLLEVAQGAAMVVDPDDLTSFSAAIFEALEDTSRQQALSISSAMVASGYSWDSCIKKTVDVYRTV